MREFDHQIEEAMKERPVVPIDVVADIHNKNKMQLEKDVHHVVDDAAPLFDGIILRLLANKEVNDINVSFDNAINHLIAYGFITEDQVGKAHVVHDDDAAYAAYVAYRKGLVEKYGDDFDTAYVLYARDHDLMNYRVRRAVRNIECDIARIADVYHMGFDGVINAILAEHEKRSAKAN